MNPFISCKDCSERRLACHKDCERYLKERAEFEKIKAQTKLNTEFYSYVSGNIAKRTDAIAKKKKKQFGYTVLN